MELLIARVKLLSKTCLDSLFINIYLAKTWKCLNIMVLLIISRFNKILSTNLNMRICELFFVILGLQEAIVLYFTMKNCCFKIHKLMNISCTKLIVLARLVYWKVKDFTNQAKQGTLNIEKRKRKHETTSTT